MPRMFSSNESEVAPPNPTLQRTWSWLALRTRPLNVKLGGRTKAPQGMPRQLIVRSRVRLGRRVVCAGHLVVLLTLSFACAPLVDRTRRVVVPIDRDGGACYDACMRSAAGPQGRTSTYGEFACLQTCQGARVDLGVCAGVSLRPNERCWTSRGRF